MTEKTIGSATLTKQFDGHWRKVIGDRIERLPTERTESGKRKPAKFKAIGELPTAEKYLQLKRKFYTTNISSLVEDAMSEVESLQDEMQSWYDNLSEGFQQTEKAERIQEAADVLSNVSGMGIDVPDEFSEVNTVYFPSLKVNSRADRAAEAASMLQAATDAAREHAENREQDEEQDELDTSWIDEVEEAIGELESVEFPGMYG